MWTLFYAQRWLILFLGDTLLSWNTVAHRIASTLLLWLLFAEPSYFCYHIVASTSYYSLDFPFLTIPCLGSRRNHQKSCNIFCTENWSPLDNGQSYLIKVSLKAFFKDNANVQRGTKVLMNSVDRPISNGRFCLVCSRCFSLFRGSIDFLLKQNGWRSALAFAFYEPSSEDCPCSELLFLSFLWRTFWSVFSSGKVYSFVAICCKALEASTPFSLNIYLSVMIRNKH